jgi:UDP-2,3-diacylglucosamine pyrophosphatase LpxH
MFVVFIGHAHRNNESRKISFFFCFCVREERRNKNIILVGDGLRTKKPTNVYLLVVTISDVIVMYPRLLIRQGQYVVIT